MDILLIAAILAFPIGFCCIIMAFRTDQPSPYNDRTREIYSERLYHQHTIYSDGSERITTVHERTGERVVETNHKRLTG